MKPLTFTIERGRAPKLELLMAWLERSEAKAAQRQKEEANQQATQPKAPEQK